VDAEPEALPQCLKTGTLGSEGLFPGEKSVVLCWGARAIEVDSEPEAKGLTGFTVVSLGLNRCAKLQLVELGFVAAR